MARFPATSLAFLDPCVRRAQVLAGGKTWRRRWWTLKKLSSLFAAAVVVCDTQFLAVGKSHQVSQQLQRALDLFTKHAEEVAGLPVSSKKLEFITNDETGRSDGCNNKVHADALRSCTRNLRGEERRETLKHSGTANGTGLAWQAGYCFEDRNTTGTEHGEKAGCDLHQHTVLREMLARQRRSTVVDERATSVCNRNIKTKRSQHNLGSSCAAGTLWQTSTQLGGHRAPTLTMSIVLQTRASFQMKRAVACTPSRQNFKGIAVEGEPSLEGT